MTSTGIRALNDNLSRYIRRIEAGERIAITAHGRRETAGMTRDARIRDNARALGYAVE